jgi:hypothetical protein
MLATAEHPIRSDDLSLSIRNIFVSINPSLITNVYQGNADIHLIKVCTMYIEL